MIYSNVYYQYYESINVNIETWILYHLLILFFTTSLSFFSLTSLFRFKPNFVILQNDILYSSYVILVTLLSSSSINPSITSSSSFLISLISNNSISFISFSSNLCIFLVLLRHLIYYFYLLNLNILPAIWFAGESYVGLINSS